ncbi:GTP-binding protein [Enterocloster sp. OA13]|uniref:CobW family GTP-binding protein n=1 Tax=Enterocloster sp. OA13 TaxID=2914161 RepID=UPI000471D9F1|nr:GTP-binding protein [Enterocloster sp. OA13]
MTKIDIISGFLGAGKTTFIKKLLEEAIAGEQVVLIENEFGEIGIDGGFLKDAGIEIREMNSGCICCSLVGDFGASLAEVITKYKPERIIIEPSGVGKLSDVVKAVVDVSADMEVELNSAVTIVDAAKCKMYMKNFGEFFNNQIENAGTIVLSRTDITDAAKVQKDVDMLREKNRDAAIITTPLAELSGAQLLEIIEKHDTMLDDLLAEVRESRQHHEEECHEHHHEGEGCHEHHHHDGEECHEHHHHDGEECHGHHHHDGEECHGHHHHDGEECHEHHHHDGEECHEHHHDGEECHGHHHHDGEECHEHHHDGEEGHEHHHHDGEECHDHHHHDHGCCGHDHGHHHADEVFTSWGMETIVPVTHDQLEDILKRLAYTEEFGQVLRAKGMLPTENPGEWLYFDLVPEQYEIREGRPDYTGKVCVIGASLEEEALNSVFGRS